MRRKRVIIILAMCVLVAIGVVAFWPGPKEPEYNGKKLSEWIQVYVDGVGRQDYSQQGQAVSAIQAMGTNALPCLLKWGRHYVPAWQERAAAQWCMRFRFTWPRRMVLERIGHSANAWWALGALGPRAHPAIPEVYRIALESPSIDVVQRAVAFLSQIGPDGAPALMEVIARGKGERRGVAMYFIGQMPNLGTNGPAVVAMLLKHLGAENEDLAASAARALGGVALDTKRVVPALAARLRDNRLSVRCGAASALGNLANNRAAAPDFHGAVPELVIAQQDPDSVVREWVTNVLWKIAPEVLTNEVKDF